MEEHSSVTVFKYFVNVSEFINCMWHLTIFDSLSFSKKVMSDSNLALEIQLWAKQTTFILREIDNKQI